MTNLTSANRSFFSLLFLIKEVPGIRWFFSKGYAQGVFWALMICVTSVSNDVLMRHLGTRLHMIEIVFFRFFFSTITLLPLLAYYGIGHLKTNHPGLHALRAILGVGAILATCYSVNLMPLAENTTIMFAEPLFFLPFAVYFLHERVDAPRWIATFIGFIGILIIIQPGTETFRPIALIPVTGAVLFALLNIMAKKMIATENTVSLLFYFAAGTTVASFIPLLFVWEAPTFSELGFLFLLGIGANMIQVCLFRAFSAADASALMPFRYVEFIFSSIIGFLVYHEIPTPWTLAGVSLIILSTFYISYVETRRELSSTAL